MTNGERPTGHPDRKTRIARVGPRRNGVGRTQGRWDDGWSCVGLGVVVAEVVPMVVVIAAVEAAVTAAEETVKVIAAKIALEVEKLGVATTVVVPAPVDDSGSATSGEPDSQE